MAVSKAKLLCTDDSETFKTNILWTLLWNWSKDSTLGYLSTKKLTKVQATGNAFSETKILLAITDFQGLRFFQKNKSCSKSS